MFRRSVFGLLALAWSHGTWAYTGTGTAEDPYVINGSNTATNWTDLRTVMASGGYIRLDANCTDGTKSSDSYLEVLSYKTVVLDLHGKTINRNLTSAIENGFAIKNEGYLTINDSGTGGTIKGGFNTGYGGGIYNIRRKISTYTGTVEINGGTITGNKALDGGGIYDKYEGATSINPSFTINGGSINNNFAEGNGGGIWTDTNMEINSGTISYNTAGGNGGGIYGAQSLKIHNCNINHNSATNGGGIYYKHTFFYMYGGSVTYNTASEKGGGILIADNTWGNQDVFFIHGTITVKDNTCGTSANNVHLMSYVYNTLTYNRHINIDDNLSSSTRIGVTVEGAPRAFTSGLSGHGSITNFFSDDATAYSVTLDDNNEAFLKKYISSVAITSIEAPSATKSFDTSASCSTEGVASKSVAWKIGTTTVTGYAVAGNTYTVEVTLTPSSGYEFANTTTATINGNTATVTKSSSNRVVSYTFPQTQKIITTIYTNPTASSITYGQTLANSTLSGGRAIRPDYSTQVSGTFAWTTPTTKPDVGNSQSFEVTFTPSDATNFATATRNVTVTVNKATPTITGTAVATAVYGTLVKDISISGLTATFGSETVSGSWAFSNIPTNNVCPSVGNTTTYSASFTPTDNTHFNTVNRNICPTITPKDLTVTANNKTITYGEERDNAGVTYEGFVNSETFSVLGGSLTYTYPKYVNSTPDGSYSAGSPVSDENTIYKIKPSGLTSNNYSITFVDGTLTVAQKEASISWSNTLFTYNGTAQKPTATVSNRVGNDVCTVTVSGEQTDASSSAYTATATELSNANYKLPTTPPTHSFKINKASLTITANDNAITYGDLPTGNGVTYSGFVNNETASVLGGTLGYTFSYAQYGNVGDNYIIVPNGLTSNNYSITFLQGTLTVAQKEATLSWTNTALTYNGTPQKPTAAVSNLVNNDYCVVAVSGEQTNASATAYTATATAFNNSNYKLPTADADKQTSFTISKAALTVTANDNAITYGDLPTGSGATYSGFVNGETASVLGGSLGYTFSYAQYGDVGDDYTITPNGLTSNNYDISFADGTLTVAQKEATLSWTNTALTYNGTSQKPTAAVSNLVNNDACTVTVSGEQTNASATAYTATATILDNDNYKLPAEDADKQTAFIISKAPLTITAKDHSITYGEEGANAGLTYTGFVNSETETTSDLTGTLSFSYCSKSTDALYLAGSDAGDDYWITANGLTSNNYAISFVQGTLTVDPKPLTITAKAQTIEYGKGIAKGTDQVTLSTDLASTDALAEITLTPSTEGYTDDGSATITPSVAVIKRDGVAKTSNYAITYVPGVLKITKKQLKITAKDKAITYGDVASNAGVTYSGFRAGESENTPGLLSGTLKYDYGGYAPGKDVGEYVITPSGLTSPNYYIIYDTGTLTVNKKTVGIAWGETLLTYCDADIAPVAIATGLYGEDQCDVIISGAAKEVGVHQATATGLSNANYQLPTTGLSTDYEIVNQLVLAFAADQQWATWYGVNDYQVPEGLKAYKVSSVSDDKVTVDAISYIPANTGVLLYRTATDAKTLTGNVYTGATSSITSLLKVGNPTPYKDYILHGNQFVLSAVSTLPPNRCYLPGSGAAGARGGLDIDTGDGTTFISLSPFSQEEGSAQWFDLQGRRIDKPQQKGVYILNGRKVVVK